MSKTWTPILHPGPHPGESEGQMLLSSQALHVAFNILSAGFHKGLDKQSKFAVTTTVLPHKAPGAESIPSCYDPRCH